VGNNQCLNPKPGVQVQFEPTRAAPLKEQPDTAAKVLARDLPAPEDGAAPGVLARGEVFAERLFELLSGVSLVPLPYSKCRTRY
jgi:hypothetical protein